MGLATAFVALALLCLAAGEQGVDVLQPAFRLASTRPVDGSEQITETGQNEDGLNPKIRAAIHSKFDDSLDAANWLNPQVIVVPKGVEVRSASLAGARGRLAWTNFGACSSDYPSPLGHTAEWSS